MLTARLLSVLAAGFALSTACNGGGVKKPVKPVAETATAASAVTPPASNLPGKPGTGSDKFPEGPTPYKYYGTPGALPDEACGRDGLFSIVSVDPSNSTPLAQNTTFPLTAMVSYSTLTTTPVWLEVYDTSFNLLYAAPASQQVMLEPGCGQVTLALDGVSTTGQQGLNVMVATNMGSDFLTMVSYQVLGMPYFKVTGLSTPLSQLLLPDADGVIHISAAAEWDFKQNTYFSYFGLEIGYVSPQSIYPDLGTGASSQTFSFSGNIRYCSDTQAIVFFENFDSGSYGPPIMLSLLTWQVQVPYLILMPLDDMRKPSNSGPQTVNAWVENCTNKERFYHLSADVPWLSVPSTVVSVPAGSWNSVSFTVDPAYAEPGTSTGHLSLIAEDPTVTTVSRSFSLTVLPPSVPLAYTVTPRTYSWFAEGTTGSATVLMVPGDDEVKTTIPTPFLVSFNGTWLSSIIVSSNGFVSIGNAPFTAYFGGTLPNDSVPNEVAVNWLDAEVASNGNVTYVTTGSAPNRQFIVSWYNNGLWPGGTEPSTYQLVFTEGSPNLIVQYGQIQSAGVAGLNTGDGFGYITWEIGQNTAFDITYTGP